MSRDIGLRTLETGFLRLGRSRKRPGCLRVQSGLSSRGSGSRRCLGSGCFRCFLRSRLLGCFLGGWLFGSRLFGCSSFLGRRFFCSCFFGWCGFLGWSLFGCRLFRGSGFLCSYCFFSRCCLFGRSSFFRCYFFRCYFFCRCSFLCGSGLFCGRFFCSCHFNFLLDQFTKSTSCELECMKRFMGLGLVPAP